MNGILLAGGRGSRLWPLTAVTNKQLLPVHDKPMIYYSLTTLMFTGATKIALISSKSDIGAFNELLGDGHQWGLDISYVVQDKPLGIAQCFELAPDEFRYDSVSVVLGDNVLYGMGLGTSLGNTFSGKGAQVYAYPVSNPSEYGVVTLDSFGNPTDIVEKPSNPRSNLAIPGIYFFDRTVWEKSTKLRLSSRNEFEIVDILRDYLNSSSLKVQLLERGTAWLDTGTTRNLISASEFVRVIEERQGLKIGCPEEIALRLGYISPADLLNLVVKMPEGLYKNYLQRISI